MVRIVKTIGIIQAIWEARLERGPEDGEFYKRHFSPSLEGSDESREEGEARWTGKERKQEESDIPKWQGGETRLHQPRHRVQRAFRILSTQ